MGTQLPEVPRQWDLEESLLHLHTHCGGPSAVQSLSELALGRLEDSTSSADVVQKEKGEIVKTLEEGVSS